MVIRLQRLLERGAQKALDWFRRGVFSITIACVVPVASSWGLLKIASVAWEVPGRVRIDSAPDDVHILLHCYYILAAIRPQNEFIMTQP